MKKGRKQFNAKEHIKEFNELRIALQNPFTLEEFRNELKARNIISGKMFVEQIIRDNIITPIVKGLYVFNNSRAPIHHSTLEITYIRYSERVKEYNKDEAEKALNKAKIRSAIAFLEGFGYTVTK